MNSKPLVFHTSAYDYLAAQLCTSHRLAKGERQMKYFPDGERYQNVLSRVDGEHVIVVGGTFDDPSTLELYDLASGLVEQGAQRLTMVVPYFAYSTMERAAIDKPGEVVAAKTRARLLSGIPLAPGGNRIFLFDLHTEQLPGFFPDPLRCRHLNGREFVRDTAIERAAGRPFVLASTDAGRAKWVESLAKAMGKPPAFAYKSRIDGSTVESRGVNGPVKDALVILYDDMIRTGGSLIEAGKAYKDAGAAEIVVIASHGVLPGDSLARLEASGLFQGIVCTDSHPRAQALRGTTSFLTVKPCGQFFVDALVGRTPQFD